LGLVRLQKPCLAVPSLQEAEEAGNTSDVDVDHQLLGISASGNSLPNVPLPDVALPNFNRPEVRPVCSVREE